MLLSPVLIIMFSYAAYQSAARSMRWFKDLLDRSPYAAASSVLGTFIEMPLIILGAQYLMGIIVGSVDPAAPQNQVLSLLCFSIATLIGMVKGLMSD